MPKKTAEQLETMLAEQIDYLESSSALYDKGRKHEAKRLAVTIRVLVHDTAMSHSLLKQLGYKHRWVFLDSAGPVNPQNLASTMNLLYARAHHHGNNVWSTSYEPMLGDTPWPPSGLSFDDWWGQIVVKDNAGEEFSRSDLVLALANQEGGAHVDQRTKGRIDALARSNTLGFMFGDPDGDAEPVDGDPILPCVRQIAYELSETIRCRQLIPSSDRATP